MENENLIFEQRKHYLLATSHGVRSDFASVLDATIKINDMAGKTPTPYLMLDYRNVKFNLPKTYAFDLIRIYETRLTNFKNITMAVILNSGDNKEFSELWYDVSQKRGFRFMTFNDFQEGENWLIQQQNL